MIKQIEKYFLIAIKSFLIANKDKKEKVEIDFDKLVSKCRFDFKDRHKNIDEIEIDSLVFATYNKFKKCDFTLEKFKEFKKITNKKHYEKQKQIKIERGETMLTGKEKALKTAAIKREKSLKVMNEVITILKANNQKLTSKNAYEIVKKDFNDCLKLTSIKMYLKEIKTNQGEK
ncbi:hypothetical protein CJ672_02770 [Arcobacter cryaerophilus gv. occultus]|uniref:hypothetical protein n=1 Tax=Aliarcobacter cryaerophilus TaxID=28198 RepID=UPI000D017C03|nr:hypothetical protein [Aliarcobacter cryaerophilus]PRM93224.1 hypothetical protein CJ672_02770 [Arcobacter cryaerophilus gv. occultus]